jgi:hypothetical protein
LNTGQGISIDVIEKPHAFWTADDWTYKLSFIIFGMVLVVSIIPVRPITWYIANKNFNSWFSHDVTNMYGRQ